MITPLVFLLLSLVGLIILFRLKLREVEGGVATAFSKFSTDFDPKLVAFEQVWVERLKALNWRQVLLFLFKILEEVGRGAYRVWHSILPSYQALHEHLRGKRKFKSTRATSVFLKDVSEHKNSLSHEADNLPKI